MGRISSVDDTVNYFVSEHLIEMGTTSHKEKDTAVSFTSGSDDDGGAFVTWEDLNVVASSKKGGYKPIISGLTGFAQPGEVLAIMGPSGSGKSTLLDALAGRLASNTRQSGQILINGRKQSLSFGTSAYVTQDDYLMTTLTVKELVYYSALLQLPSSMSKAKKIERAEMTIEEMGLQDIMDQRIGGNWTTKSLSGGQRRRVSICLETLTHPKLLFLDEPTSGLDSAGSYLVMSQLICLAQEHRTTVIASIHQPSSEVFQLFDNLCLLSCGKTIYFGSAIDAMEFFASNGFPCPPRRNPSDHYLRIINKDFDKCKKIKGKNSSESIPASEAIDKLIKSYQSSTILEEVETRVLEIRENTSPEMITTTKKANGNSILDQSLVLTRRSFANMNREIGYYWLRFATYMLLCPSMGVIFYDLGHSFDSIRARLGMLMFVVTIFTFMAIGGFPSFVEDMKIFGRERLNGHYGVSSFVIANTISSIPFLIIIAIIPGSILYYLAGLQGSAEHYCYFILVIAVCLLLVESLMMIVSSLVPNFLMGILVGAGIQGVMMLNGGFFKLPDELPKPIWRYPMYYIAFHKYAIQGLYKNEFIGLYFPKYSFGGSSSLSGEEILRDAWQVEMHSKWIDLSILVGMFVAYRTLFIVIVKVAEKVKPKLGKLCIR